MYGVFVVEDEPWARRGIMNLIDWNAHNMEIVGSAEDGFEALDLIRSGSVRPDILLTDIRMPDKSGLDLLDELIDIQPSLHAVILSGYRDFEYARQALRFGVFEYLVKPVGKKVLLETMTRLIARIEGKTSEVSSVTPQGQKAPLLIRHTVELVEQYITEPSSLANVAAELSVNAAYLSNLFSEHMGENFKHYVARRKIEKAKIIWRDHPWLKVYELCERVGYRDVNHFSQMFKSIEGVTPREYKTQPVHAEQNK